MRALLFAPNLSLLPWLSLIYGDEGFLGDFLTGFKGRSRVMGLAAGESDGPPGRALCLGSALLAGLSRTHSASSDSLCPILPLPQHVRLPGARPSPFLPCKTRWLPAPTQRHELSLRLRFKALRKLAPFALSPICSPSPGHLHLHSPCHKPHQFACLANILLFLLPPSLLNTFPFPHSPAHHQLLLCLF